MNVLRRGLCFLLLLSWSSPPAHPALGDSVLMAAVLLLDGAAMAQEGWALGLQEGTCSLGPRGVTVPAAKQWDKLLVTSLLDFA